VVLSRLRKTLGTNSNPGLKSRLLRSVVSYEGLSFPFIRFCTVLHVADGDHIEVMILMNGPVHVGCVLRFV
jgi:hypothetical protein